MNDRNVGVLRDGQDAAIVLLRRLSIMLITVAMLRAVGVLVSLDVIGKMLCGRRKLLEEMVYPMRRRSDRKKPKCAGHAQV
ncbi:MAG: hypothetical protein ACREP3_07855 [Candidatus Binatia bacterium]